MTGDELHKISLNYGKTNSSNLPHMPNDKYFAIGYNDRFGLVDVCEGDGTPFFEGRVNIESLLPKLRSQDPENLDSNVEKHIMEAYTNYWAHRINLREYTDKPSPMLEVLSYNG